MSGIRFATAEQVTRCWTSIPRVTHFDQADITSLEALRQKYKERAAKAGGNLTMAVMVVKVVALALKKFPSFNASVDMASREIVYKDYVNVGIAVATERGLMVPVLRDTDGKNMVELAAEIGELALKCREGRIKPDELQGGTFTVTNLGSIGGSHFTPIVNYPEVAILGLGRSAKQLSLVEGKVESRTVLPLSLSYDHRLIDGADAARFTRWIAEAIEEPLLLSLEG
jgi:pyruvate dehydrogenase E2 component (dihydrolipoamide acetyltransferase)